MKSYSQCGEDLILFDFFTKTKLKKGFFFEFGAWDGIFLSNCRMFYEQGWGGCFIEANKKRFEDLKKNYSNDPKIKLVNELINTTNNNLDNIIKNNKINEIDLLSIDIDGHDLSVWKTLNNLRPKFVVMEYNKLIPFDVEFEDKTNQFVGSSALSIYKYALSKDYELIAATSPNLIFVDKFFNKKTIKSINIENVFNEIKPLRIGFNHFGEMLFFEKNKLNFKEYFKFPIQKSFITFQPIPKFLRRMTDVNGKGAKKLKMFYSYIILIILRPNLFFLKIKNKIENLIKKNK